MTAEYIKGEQVSLRALGLDERWLQERISEDPSILGLGDLTLLKREKTQVSGGRLDFLMADPEEDIRYEIEVMLGKLDESHIIRTIEYWDMERTRYPNLEHRAVIVAEDITNRFFNVISILNRAVPVIAVQMTAVRFEGNKFVLSFTKALDVAELRTPEDEPSGELADRQYWQNRSSRESLAVVDALLPLITAQNRQPRVAYNKSHIAIGTTGRNFIWCWPRKAAPHCFFDLKLDGELRAEWIKKLDEVGIYAGTRGSAMKMRINLKELQEQSTLLKELLSVCESNASGMT